MGREFFVPAQTLIGVKLVTAKAEVAHEHRLFNKLLW